MEFSWMVPDAVIGGVAILSSLRILYEYEPRSVAFWRGIDATVRITAGHDCKRRIPDEILNPINHVRPHFVRGSFRRLAVDFLSLVHSASLFT